MTDQPAQSQLSGRQVAAATLGTFLLYILGIIALVFVQVLIETFWPGLESSPLWNGAFGLLDAVLMSVLALLALRRLGFGLRIIESGMSIGRTAESILTGGLIFAALELAFYLSPLPVETHPALEDLGSSGLADAAPILLGLLAFAPISEELLVRGLFQNAVRAVLPVWPALVTINLLFAVLHLLPGLMLYSFMAGLLISFVYERNRSILMTIGIHFTINLCSVLQFLFLEICPS